jgi:hypothetical protein
VLRRKQKGPAPVLPERPFLEALRSVEEAKAALVSAVPSPRGAARPLAEALHEFDSCLRSALEAMAGWRVAALEAEWHACSRGVEDGLRRCESLRMRAPDLGFEALLVELAELIEPLEPFERAAERFRELGSRLR